MISDYNGKPKLISFHSLVFGLRYTPAGTRLTLTSEKRCFGVVGATSGETTLKHCWVDVLSGQNLRRQEKLP